MLMRTLILGLSVGVMSTSPSLACSIKTNGAKCATAKAPPAYVAEERAAISVYGVGDTLPRGKYFMLMNSQRYGLPPASDGLLYFRAGQQVLRVNLDTMEVHEDVTDRLTRRLP